MTGASGINTALEHAIAQFEYREKATGRRLPCDPDWQRVMIGFVNAALAGERGDTDQAQCVYQAIRLTVWESGAVKAPWTKAFLPPGLAVRPVRYRRWWNRVAVWGRSLLRRLRDIL